MAEKEECLTYTTGAVEVRQTAHEITIINHGMEPIPVRILSPGQPIMGHAAFTPYSPQTLEDLTAQILSDVDAGRLPPSLLLRGKEVNHGQGHDDRRGG